MSATGSGGEDAATPAAGRRRYSCRRHLLWVLESMVSDFVLDGDVGGE